MSEWLGSSSAGTEVPAPNGPKELHWIEGAGHVDLYDKKQYVDPAVDRLTGFCTTRLTAG